MPTLCAGLVAHLQAQGRVTDMELDGGAAAAATSGTAAGAGVKAEGGVELLVDATSLSPKVGAFQLSEHITTHISYS